MTATEGKIAVTEGEGVNLATVEVTLDDGTVAHIEGVYVGDPEDKDARQNVVPLVRQPDQYAARVIDENSRSIEGALQAIYEQNERILMMLESIAE